MLDPWDALPGEVGFERGQQVALALAKAGNDVVWWHAGFSHAEKRVRSGTFSVSELFPGVQLILLPTRSYRDNAGIRRLLSIGDYAWQFMLRHRRFPLPDLLLVEGPIFFSEPVLLWLKIARKVKLVINFRDLWPEAIINATPNGLARSLRRLGFSGAFAMRRLLFRHCDGIISMNAAYLSTARREAGRRWRGLSAVTYPSPELPRVQGDFPKEKAAGEIWVISSGTLGASNDHGTLLAAAALLRDRCSNLRFVVTGIGQHADAVRGEILRKNLTNVTYRGVLPPGQFRFLLAECDIGLALYRRFSPVEFPTKVVDYLLAGLAVIISGDGEASTLLVHERAGQSTPPENPQVLADLLDRLAGNPDHVAFMRRNAVALSERFEHDRQIDAVVAMLGKLGPGATVR